ncbi:lipopolysaccharide biosynthesis protein [Furfurilactobacillus sp. WILCCON 0119]
MKTTNEHVKNSLVNILTASYSYVFTLFLTVIVRGIMVYTLGQKYVGLNGVMASVLSSFSLADLGIDSVLLFLLFEPLEKKAYEQVYQLTKLFQKIYFCIGIVFFTIGLIALPFTKQIFGLQTVQIKSFVWIYLLFLINAGVSYFFVYYRTLLNADQQSYVIARITLIVNIITGVAQVAGLLVTKNFVTYAVIQLIGTLILNLVIEATAKRKYLFLTASSKKPWHRPDHNVISTLIKNTVGGVSNKIGSVIVFSSDNILLAHFETLALVGMYSNYMLIVQGAAAFFSKIIASTTATIGNFGVAADPSKNLKLFIRVNVILNVIISLMIVPLILCFSAFVRLWLGAHSVLPFMSVNIIVINFVLQIQRYPSLTFIDAFGLQWIQKWKSVIESLINIGVSLFLLMSFHAGLNGVLLGTLISTLTVVSWYEPYIVLRNVCDKQYRKFIGMALPFILLFTCELFLADGMLRFFPVIILWKALLFAIVFDCLLVLIYFVVFNRNGKLQSVIKGFQNDAH